MAPRRSGTLQQFCNTAMNYFDIQVTSDYDKLVSLKVKEVWIGKMFLSVTFCGDFAMLCVCLFPSLVVVVFLTRLFHNFQAVFLGEMFEEDIHFPVMVKLHRKSLNNEMNTIGIKYIQD